MAEDKPQDDYEDMEAYSSDEEEAAEPAANTAEKP